MMHLTDFIAISPLIIVAASATAVMLLISLFRHHGATAAVVIAGLAAALATLPAAASFTPLNITPLLIMDWYAVFFIGLILSATIITVLISYGYLRQHNGHREEYYLLILVAALGSAVLITSRHFAAFFLGLEILSVSLYTLIAYTRSRTQSIEAGIKYLVLAAVSSAFMLFGMALIYADLGTLDFTMIAFHFQTLQGQGLPVVLSAGMGLIIVAVGFKLALAPFHMWTPDIYQGAPAPVTAFVASVSKGAMVALLVRLFAPIDLNQQDALFSVFAGLAIASMVVGNVLALLQSNIKRLLAYSSIGHMGYLLVAFLASGNFAISAVTFYLVAYTFTILGCFGVISVLSGQDRDADAMDDFQGLYFRFPWITGFFTAMLLSLAGIPLTAGFVGKFYILAAGVKDGLWALIFVLVLSSGIGLFYYLRLIIAMYRHPSGKDYINEKPFRIAPLSSLSLMFLLIMVLWLGILPDLFIEWIHKMIQ